MWSDRYWTRRWEPSLEPNHLSVMRILAAVLAQHRDLHNTREKLRFLLTPAVSLGDGCDPDCGQIFIVFRGVNLELLAVAQPWGGVRQSMVESSSGGEMVDACSGDFDGNWDRAGEDGCG